MKLRGAHGCHGGTLFGMLVMIGILATVLVGYLSVIEIQARRTSRWQSWNLCVPVAEAGLEEAMAHLNHTGGSNLAGSGWVFSADRGAYIKEHTLDDGRYEAAISTNNPPVITSTGRMRVRGTGAEVSRRLTLTTRANAGLRGIVSTTLATLKDFASADSYDSSLTGGPYSLITARDRTFIGNISSASASTDIHGSAKIYGLVACGATAGLKIHGMASIGDRPWVNNPANAGWYKPGHFLETLRVTVTNITLPFTGGAPLTTGVVAGIAYSAVLQTADYKRIGTLTLDGSSKMIVVGNARLYVTDTFDVKDTAEIIIQPGASLELYLGRQFYASGNARVNATGFPRQFTYFGMTSNAEFYMSGSATMNGTFYTAVAKVDLSGDAQLSGAGACRDLVMHGNFKFHYDESLNAAPEQPFNITSWDEL